VVWDVDVILKGRVEGGFGGEWEACVGRVDCVEQKSPSFFKDRSDAVAKKSRVRDTSSERVADLKDSDRIAPFGVKGR